MTIDEAIKHAEEVAEQNKWFSKNCLESIQCKECAEEHQQLAEWLKELKIYKENEPKTGHWISHREHCENLGVMPSGLGTYKWCSNCDCGIDVEEWHRNHYNYCPNCGAKMKEVQEK